MVYLLNQTPNRYRWVSIVENDDDWGLQVANLKGNSVGPDFGPINIEWTPETINRDICDFPNFRPNLLCISRRAADILRAILEPEGELIDLCGLDDRYMAFYCLNVVNALSHIDIKPDETRFGTFHSPTFAPTLSSIALPSAEIFRIPESISKLFVSERFKYLCDSNSLTGLEFVKTPLT